MIGGFLSVTEGDLAERLPWLMAEREGEIILTRGGGGSPGAGGGDGGGVVAVGTQTWP